MPNIDLIELKGAKLAVPAGAAVLQSARRCGQ